MSWLTGPITDFDVALPNGSDGSGVDDVAGGDFLQQQMKLAFLPGQAEFPGTSLALT